MSGERSKVKPFFEFAVFSSYGTNSKRTVSAHRHGPATVRLGVAHTLYVRAHVTPYVIYSTATRLPKNNNKNNNNDVRRRQRAYSDIGFDVLPGPRTCFRPEQWFDNNSKRFLILIPYAEPTRGRLDVNKVINVLKFSGRSRDRHRPARLLSRRGHR